MFGHKLSGFKKHEDAMGKALIKIEEWLNKNGNKKFANPNDPLLKTLEKNNLQLQAAMLRAQNDPQAQKDSYPIRTTHELIFDAAQEKLDYANKLLAYHRNPKRDADAPPLQPFKQNPPGIYIPPNSEFKHYSELEEEIGESINTINRDKKPILPIENIKAENFRLKALLIEGEGHLAKKANKKDYASRRKIRELLLQKAKNILKESQQYVEQYQQLGKPLPLPQVETVQELYATWIVCRYKNFSGYKKEVGNRLLKINEIIASGNRGNILIELINETTMWCNAALSFSRQKINKHAQYEKKNKINEVILGEVLVDLNARNEHLPLNVHREGAPNPSPRQLMQQFNLLSPRSTQSLEECEDKLGAELIILEARVKRGVSQEDRAAGKNNSIEEQRKIIEDLCMELNRYKSKQAPHDALLSQLLVRGCDALIEKASDAEIMQQQAKRIARLDETVKRFDKKKQPVSARPLRLVEPHSLLVINDPDEEEEINSNSFFCCCTKKTAKQKQAKLPPLQEPLLLEPLIVRIDDFSNVDDAKHGEYEPPAFR